MKKLREKRKEAELCIYCGKEKDRQGYYCQSCNEVKMKYKIKQKENKICTQCGNTLDKDGWFCQSCTNDMRVKANSKYEYRRQNQLCIQCGIKTDGLYKYCQGCRDTRMNRYWEKKDKIRKAP